MDVAAIIAIIGGIAFIVGLFGGGLEAKEIKIPKIAGSLRALSMLVGIGFIGVAVWLSYSDRVLPTSPSTSVAAVTHTSIASTLTEASTAEIKATPVRATPGQTLNMVLLPKFMGPLLFDQTYDGAREAHVELKNAGKLEFLGPTADNSAAGQIEIVTNATRRSVDAIMISNNAGDQIVSSAEAARDKGITFVTWDSSIPAAEGEQLFVAPVDFNETGKVMAEMALDVLGTEGGKFAVLSASPDAANQNAFIADLKEVLKDPKYSKLVLLDIVYGNDISEDSYNRALALVSKYPDMELIMAPTYVGIVSAAKAMQEKGLCEKVKVSGLGLPSEMVEFTRNDCAPEFALWSFVDLGYLTYYTTYLLATGAIKGEAGENFEAGRMGIYTIENDPTRDKGLWVLMGPWTIYDKNNIQAGVQ
jgi:rhamnose transport system substrate-binding protein